MFIHSVTVTLYQTHLRYEEKPHPAARGALPSLTQRPHTPFPPKRPRAPPVAPHGARGGAGRENGHRPLQGGSQSRALRERPRCQGGARPRRREAKQRTAMSAVLDVLWEDRDVRFDISPQWVTLACTALTAGLRGPGRGGRCYRCLLVNWVRPLWAARCVPGRPRCDGCSVTWRGGAGRGGGRAVPCRWGAARWRFCLLKATTQT